MMPPNDPQDQWRFKFRRRETEDSATLVYCNLTRTNQSQWLAGYQLQLTVKEHADTWSSKRWIGIESCSAKALESAVPPSYLTEQVLMENAAGDVAPEVLALAYLVTLCFFGLFVAWCILPHPLRELRRRCCGAKEAKVFSSST